MVRLKVNVGSIPTTFQKIINIMFEILSNKSFIYHSLSGEAIDCWALSSFVDFGKDHVKYAREAFHRLGLSDLNYRKINLNWPIERNFKIIEFYKNTCKIPIEEIEGEGVFPTVKNRKYLPIIIDYMNKYYKSIDINLL